MNDAGLETDIIFNKGVDIREFAAHTLLSDPAGREVLANYFREMLSLAKSTGAGFVLDCPTWKAHMHWAKDLAATEEEMRQANIDSVAFVAGLRDEFSTNEQPIIINALIGPRGDAYAPEIDIAAAEAEKYHAQQIGWLAETDVDMVSALTFPQADEAIGAVRAAKAVLLVCQLSFPSLSKLTANFLQGNHSETRFSRSTQQPIVRQLISWSIALTQNISQE